VTFAERVSYQRTIEEVYWRHRICPKENLDPKPSLDAVMTEAQLEKKVTDYLQKSQTLEDYWQKPITADQLQAEMDRMAQHTKQPEVLRELFAALGNDPLVIAECLARPLLVERLLTQSASDQVKQISLTHERVIAATGDYRFPSISNDGGCTDDTWTATTTSNAPSGRYYHTAVWTGSEMIVWGGRGGLNTGGRYNPSTDSWTATSLTNAPTARSGHTAIWTGSEMIVWGGAIPGNLFDTGGRYNPSTDSWIATSTTNAPTARSGHTAAWTGSEMIVWGGGGARAVLNTGGRYNPSTDSWTATSLTNAPSARSGHTAIWTGSEMIVWGGILRSNTGGKYSPSTDSWMATSTTNAPSGRYLHTVVWTGSEMIVWGGYHNGSLDTGGRYNPSTDSWTATSTTNAPAGRYFHTAVWTSSEMIVWGGSAGGRGFNTGGRYNPSTDSWTATSTTNAPAGRYFHTAIWTGSEMINWGGNAFGLGITNTGGRYCATALPAELGNISTRAFVQIGDDVMIGGFVIQGTESKRVIIRVIGPELSAPPFNIPDALANPTLELHDGTGALIGSNNNWATTIIGGIITANQVQDIRSSGYAPSDGLESAIIADLAPGNYTAIVRGVNNMTGVALVEVYALSGNASSILANISTRGFVQTDDNVMIGGFIVQGTQPKRVIIRAIGPELSAPPFNIPNALANPTLELHDSTGALIASNDNWQVTIIGGIITSDQVAAIRASGHAPGDPAESAIIAELPPGNYTAIVRGVNNTTGVGLVEVYDLD
jgi:N-acetylneuraminic acid mutarotase